MVDDRVVTLTVALACLFVVGSAAGSLESAVESSPSDAIDLDYTSLPLDRDQANDIKREYQQFTKRPNGESEQQVQVSSSESEAQTQQPRDSDEEHAASSSSSPTQSKTGKSDTRDFLEGLLDALLALLAELVTLLVGAIVLVGLALAFKYREYIVERLSPFLARFGGAEADPAESAAVTPPATPQNEVAEAWYEMVQRVQLDDERPLTPRERAYIARQNGADSSTVLSLTELFEEVQYGGAPVTEDRRRRARQCLDRFRRTDGGSES